MRDFDLGFHERVDCFVRAPFIDYTVTDQACDVHLMVLMLKSTFDFRNPRPPRNRVRMGKN
eukprot:1330418-Amphidinium_carterae.1